MFRLTKSLLFAFTVLLILTALLIASASKALKDSTNAELERRLVQAASHVRVLDTPTNTKPVVGVRSETAVGKVAADEFLASFRVVGYYSGHANLPSSLEQATPQSAAMQAPILDPWGKPLRLEPHGTSQFFIVSGGPTGEAHLTWEEVASLETQPTGHIYQLNSKIVFMGELPKIAGH